MGLQHHVLILLFRCLFLKSIHLTVIGWMKKKCLAWRHCILIHTLLERSTKLWYKSLTSNSHFGIKLQLKWGLGYQTSTLLVRCVSLKSVRLGEENMSCKWKYLTMRWIPLLIVAMEYVSYIWRSIFANFNLFYNNERFFLWYCIRSFNHSHKNVSSCISIICLSIYKHNYGVIGRLKIGH